MKEVSPLLAKNRFQVIVCVATQGQPGPLQLRASHSVKPAAVVDSPPELVQKVGSVGDVVSRYCGLHYLVRAESHQFSLSQSVLVVSGTFGVFKSINDRFNSDTEKAKT